MSFHFPSFLTYSLLITFTLSWFTWGNYILYPFKIFTTWVHECCHALMALMMGGTVKKIHLFPDSSGVTHFQLPSGKVRHCLVVSAGYLGSSGVGCLLYYLALRYSKSAPTTLLILGIFMLLSLVLWIRNTFGVISALIMALLFVFFGRTGSPYYSWCLLSFLSIQTSLNAFFDIRTLFSLNKKIQSDAQVMQKLFYLPAWFWALLWLGISGEMTYLTLSRT
jgi:hypothetical protein